VDGTALPVAIFVSLHLVEAGVFAQNRAHTPIVALSEAAAPMLDLRRAGSFQDSEVFSFGGDVTGLVPPNVLKRLRGRMNKG